MHVHVAQGHGIRNSAFSWGSDGQLPGHRDKIMQQGTKKSVISGVPKDKLEEL